MEFANINNQLPAQDISFTEPIQINTIAIIFKHKKEIKHVQPHNHALKIPDISLMWRLEHAWMHFLLQFNNR